MQIIKGRHPVYEALKSGQEIERILLSYQSQNDPDIIKIVQLAKNRRIKIQIAANKTALRKEGFDFMLETTRQIIMIKTTE